MAIRNLFGRGIGLTGGLIKWVVTRGYSIGEAVAQAGALTGTLTLSPSLTGTVSCDASLSGTVAIANSLTGTLTLEPE